RVRMGAGLRLPGQRLRAEPRARRVPCRLHPGQALARRWCRSPAIGYKRRMKTNGRSAGHEDDARGARDLPAEENADLCQGCVKCCTYITIEIDAPRAAWEYDQWIWALHHRTIQIYVEKPERWFIHVDTVCRQLDAAGRC